MQFLLSTFTCTWVSEEMYFLLDVCFGKLKAHAVKNVQHLI